jgi:hypothetical protein
MKTCCIHSFYKIDLWPTLSSRVLACNGRLLWPYIDERHLGLLVIRIAGFDAYLETIVADVVDANRSLITVVE